MLSTIVWSIFIIFFTWFFAAVTAIVYIYAKISDWHVLYRIVIEAFCGILVVVGTVCTRNLSLVIKEGIVITSTDILNYTAFRIKVLIVCILAGILLFMSNLFTGWFKKYPKNAEGEMSQERISDLWAFLTVCLMAVVIALVLCDIAVNYLQYL